MMAYIECIAPIVKLKLTAMLKSILCDYSGVYILLKEATTSNEVGSSNDETNFPLNYY